MKGLYLVTPDWDDTARLLAVTDEALQGGATLLQYRHKTADATLRRQQAEALLQLCRRHGCPLVINDFADLCMAIDADGVHVGGTDASVAQMRALLGPAKIVGASCYGDLQLARTAHAMGASYVAFGGFYPSRVKQYPVTTAAAIVAHSRAEIPLPVVVTAEFLNVHSKNAVLTLLGTPVKETGIVKLTVVLPTPISCA